MGEACDANTVKTETKSVNLSSEKQAICTYETWFILYICERISVHECFLIVSLDCVPFLHVYRSKIHGS